MSHLIYSAQRRGFEPGKIYQNPKYFTGKVEAVDHVTVIGDWPRIVQAYDKAGIGVEVIDSVPRAPISTDGPTVGEYVAAGYLASNYPPCGYASLSTPDEIAAAIAAQADPIDLGTDSGEQLSDEQLRATIEAVTGAAPHHKTGRAKLIETFNQINARTSSVNGTVENGSHGDAS